MKLAIVDLKLKSQLFLKLEVCRTELVHEVAGSEVCENRKNVKLKAVCRCTSDGQPLCCLTFTKCKRCSLSKGCFL